jgi:hypothetical protein
MEYNAPFLRLVGRAQTLVLGTTPSCPSDAIKGITNSTCAEEVLGLDD